MSNFTKSKTVKFIGLAVAVLMFAGVVAVPVAHAITLAELVNLFIALEIIPADKADAARAALAGQTSTNGGSTAAVCPYTWTTSLDVGSSGADVLNLQKFLNADSDTKLGSSGAGSPGSETDFFGSITKAGVVKFQDKYASDVLTPIGLSSGTGYFGTMSIAKANELCSTAAPVTTTPGDTTTTPPVVVVPAGTGLTVTKHPTQPANMLAPSNAGRVPFTKIQLTASSDGSVVVDSIVIERQGQASGDSFNGIMLMNEDGTLIGIEKTLNSNSRATIGTAFTIPAGTTKTVIIGANMNDGVASQAGELPSIAVVGINTGATVNGSLPIVGATHTVNNNLSIGTVAVQTGSLDPGAGLTKEVGTTDFTFSGIKLTAGSNENITLRSIRWYQSGSAAAGDLENLKTVVGGTEYALTNGFGKYYTTVFPDGGIQIKKGFSQEISVKGDIIGGSDRTVDFDIDRRTDINVFGDTFGYGIRPPLEGAAAATDGGDFNNQDNPFYDARQHTISKGSMQVSSWTIGVPAQNLAENVLNQPIAGFTFDVKGEPVSVSSLTFTFNISDGDPATKGSGSGSESLADVTNVTLVDENGIVIAGPADGSGTGANGTIQLSDTVTFPVGITNVILKAKIGTAFDNNDTIQASTTPSTSFGTVTGQITNNTITPSPTSAVTGPKQTIKAGSLTISVSDSPTAQTVIAGATQFEFARYILDAGESGEDLKVVSLPLYYDTDSGNRNDLSNCQIYDGSTVLNSSDILNPASGDTASSTTMTFSGTGLILPKGTSKTLSLKCNVTTGVTTAYWWGIDSGTDITSVTGITSGQTIGETVIDANGQVMTAAASGSYTVSNVSDLQYRVSQGNSTGSPIDVVISKLIFEASIEEDIEINKIAFALGSTTFNRPSDLIGEKASLWHGSTKIGDIQFNTGANKDNATSTLSTPLLITRGDSKTVTIKGDFVSQDPLYVSKTRHPGTFVQIEYDGDNRDTTTPSKGGNYATGVSSGVRIAGPSGDIAPTGVRIFRAYPTLEVCPKSDPCATTLSTGSGLYTVKVTASSERGIAIHAMTFDISAQGLGADSWTLRGPISDVNIGGTATSTSGADVSGGASATAAVGADGRRLRINFDNSSQDRWIEKGTSKVYTLRADSITWGDSNTDTDSISIRLLGDSSYATGTLITMLTASDDTATSSRMATVASIEGGSNQGDGASTSDRFIWSPNSTTSPSQAFSTKIDNLDWTNSYGLPGFPGLGANMNVKTFTR